MSQDRIAVLLRVLRDHPWSDAWQLAGLSGMPRRTVYAVLNRMVRERLIWSVRVGVPDVRGVLYAPGREGLIRLAGGSGLAGCYARAFGLDPMGLGRALLRVRALSWGRNFLVSLLWQGQYLVWAVTPARLSAGSRTLTLDGLGVVEPRPGQRITFGLLADVGGVSVEGWADQLRLFALWAGEQRVQPVLTILTSNDVRAAQFVLLWDDLTRRRGAEQKGRIYVGVVENLAAGATQWLSSHGARRYLWEAAPGDPEGLPRPWPEIEPTRPRRRVRLEALGACSLHGSLGGNAVLHAFREMRGMEQRVLEAVASWPLLRSVELAALMKLRAGRVARAIDRLQELGLIEETVFLEEMGKRRWLLSPLGIKLLAATHGMPARRFGRARHWPVGRKGPVQLRLGAYSYAVQHTLLTVEFMLGLRRLADWWWEAGYFHQLAIWDSVECIRRYFDARGRRRLIRPDAGGVYQVGRKVYPFLLEVDRDRGHRERIAAKFRKYYESRRWPGPLEIGPMPRVLILCNEEGRARQINEVLVELAEEFKEPVLDAAIATLERIRFRGRFREDGSVEKVESQGRGRPVAIGMWPGLREWRLAGKEFGRLTWCFEGLAPGERYAALRPFDLHALGQEVRRMNKMSRAQRERRRRERAAAVEG